jgi:hypothetical protein
VVDLYESNGGRPPHLRSALLKLLLRSLGTYYSYVRLGQSRTRGLGTSGELVLETYEET